MKELRSLLLLHAGKRNRFTSYSHNQGRLFKSSPVYMLFLSATNLPVDAVRAVDHDDGGGDDHDGRVDDHVVPVVVRRAPTQLSRLQEANKYVFRSAPQFL